MVHALPRLDTAERVLDRCGVDPVHVVLQRPPIGFVVLNVVFNDAPAPLARRVKHNWI